MKRAAGFSLIEVVIAEVIAGLIIAAGMSIAVQQRVFYTTVADAAGAVGTLNQLDITLAGELLPLNATAGDLVYAGSDSMRFRLFRGVFHVCEKHASTVSLTVRRLTRGGTPEAGDSAMVYSLGPTADFTDDLWEPVEISGMSASLCPDSADAFRVKVTGLNSTEFDAVTIGSPLRLYGVASYWFKSTAEGWELMRTDRDGSTVTLAGPFVGSGESIPAFRYYDDLGTATTDESQVVRVDVSVSAVRRVSGSRAEAKPVNRQLSFHLRNE